MEQPPEISVYDHYGVEGETLSSLQTFAERAIGRTLRIPSATGNAPSPLEAANEVEVSLVSDQRIAEVHVDFMNIEGATDVITFHHGEIVVSVDTGQQRAVDFGNTVQKELALYIAHGLLHLHGYEDRTPGEAETMRLLQEQVLCECWVD